MTEQDALYRAIVASPEDDTPRLVYADWLEENGRAEEAEFIRLDCKLSAVGLSDPKWSESEHRLEELRLWLQAHTPGPKLKLRNRLEVASGGWWRNTQRGFPGFIQLAESPQGLGGVRGVRRLCEALEHAFSIVPTRWLVLGRVTIEEWAEFLKQPVISALEFLTVSTEQPVADEAARLFAECKHLHNLRGAALFPFGEAGAEALSRSDNFGRLQWLILDPSTLTPAAIRSLSERAALQRHLRMLIVTEGMTAAAFEELCRLAPFAQLHTLTFFAARFPTSSWEEFARTRSFPELRRLELNSADLHEGQMSAIARAANLQLSAINLHACSIGDEGVAALLDAPWIDSLRSLDVGSNRLSSNAAESLAGCSKLAQLTQLDLSSNFEVGIEGLHALAASPFLRNLLKLNVDECLDHHFSTTSQPTQPLKDFLQMLELPRLRHLDLSHAKIGVEEAALLGRDKFRHLTRLILRQCQISDEVVKGLLRSPSWQNLLELNLASNHLKESVAVLSDRSCLPRLSACQLQNNPIPEPLRLKLARRPGVMV